MFFMIIQWPDELGVGQVMSKDWCTSGQLSVDRHIGTLRIAKGRWVFRSIFRRVMRSLELWADHILPL
jgi:hypothetical protein